MDGGNGALIDFLPDFLAMARYMAVLYQKQAHSSIFESNPASSQFDPEAEFRFRVVGTAPCGKTASGGASFRHQSGAGRARIVVRSNREGRVASSSFEGSFCQPGTAGWPASMELA